LPTQDLEFIQQECVNAINNLDGKSILMTGGTGFVGKWLLESIMHACGALGISPKVFVLSRDPGAFLERHPQFDHACLRFLQGNIVDFAPPDGPLDFIIHAATESNAELNRVHPEVALETTILGMKNILEVARKTSASRVLFTSSGAVYGKSAGENDAFHEDSPSVLSPVDAGSAYGEGKRIAELMGAIASRRYGFDFLVARLFAFVGPHLPLQSNYAIGNFIDDVLQNRKITVRGDGTAIRSYMYAADLVIWLLKILCNGQSCSPYNVGSPHPVSSPYNVGSPHPVSIRELAGIIGGLYDTEVEVMGTPVPGATPEKYLPSTAKAVRELGLGLNFSLEESIARTVDWHRGRRAP
jgi:dTDP-glucose 4,6-dehydratase